MPEPPTAPDSPLLAETAEALYRLQWPLATFARGLVGDEEQARDIVQDVIIAAWRLAQRGAAPFAAGAGDEGSRRRWLFHAVYWHAISARRRERLIRWESLDAPERPYGPDGERFYDLRPLEDRVVEGEVLRQTLASLTTEDAACILLTVVQGLTSVEVAQIVGIAPEAARKRITRAKQRLRAAYFAQDAAAREREDA